MASSTQTRAPRTYTMRANTLQADRATAELTRWLEGNFRGILRVENVERDPFYQRKDIDLRLHTTRSERGERTPIPVEVKADSYPPRNFFLETVSNAGRQTPGCFLYTESELLFYYFHKAPEKPLYILPTELLRNWFLKRLHQFVEREVQTPTQSGERYTTIGRLVPVARVMRELGSHIRQHSLAR